MSNNTAAQNSLTFPVPSYRQGVILVFIAGLCWSTMGLGIRFMEIANVWQILFYRSIALTLFLFIVITLRSSGRPLQVIRKAGLAGIIGGLGLVFAFTGGIFAIQSTSVANAMFLFAAAPFIAAFLGWFILGELVRTTTWVALIIALSGITIMVWEGMASGHLAGNISALVSALGFAIFTITLRWRKLVEMMPTVFLAGLFALITSGCISYMLEYTLQIPLNDILIALSMGVFQVGAGLIFYTIGSKSVPAVELTLISLTEVVLGPLWVWIALGETVSLYTLLGGMVLLGAIAGNALSGLKKKPVPIL
ncbi:MAG: DMT family transporter [Gammaproteobacteria bacterium]|jgi:drug/metabolite transporter, DME family|nr:DMT family transporter [Gammaproteobacteria bacterium]MBT3724617.1 DMT family transporter [Gammaproteobacteria bacterium]MBT4195795.1 DMT family transporter [Gammaproteobacteria bacterium]MBT4448113.1 DMT family transporter [Gammaproteobacteria bacterium]MBT4859631.1 DMT family transporter [Gammaproteobacteria bacterium]